MLKIIRKIVFTSLCIFIFLCQFQIPANAEKQLYLGNAINMAFENNNELKAFRKALSAQKKNIKSKRSALLPKLRFEESFLSTNNPSQFLALILNQQRFSNRELNNLPLSINKPPPINNFLTAFTLEQPILDRQGKITWDIAKNEYSAFEYDFLRKNEEVIHGVVLAYLQVYKNKLLLDNAVINIKETKQNLKIAKDKSNSKSNADITRASVSVTTSEELYSLRKKNLLISKRALGLAIGLVESFDVIATILPELPLCEIDYYNDKSMSRNDLKSLEMKKVLAKNNVKLAQAEYYPKIAMNGSYLFYDHRYPFGEEGHNYITGAYIKWTGFDGLKRHYETSKSKDKLAEVEELLEGYKKKVLFQVYESYLNVVEAQRNLKLSKIELKEAIESKNNIFEEYKKNIEPIIDLLSGQVRLNLARINYIENQYKQASALFNLSYMSGTILEDLQIKDVRGIK